MKYSMEAVLPPSELGPATLWSYFHEKYEINFLLLQFCTVILLFLFCRKFIGSYVNGFAFQEVFGQRIYQSLKVPASSLEYLYQKANINVSIRCFILYFFVLYLCFILATNSITRNLKWVSTILVEFLNVCLYWKDHQFPRRDTLKSRSPFRSKACLIFIPSTHLLTLFCFFSFCLFA
jgi:hypothetical protein